MSDRTGLVARLCLVTFRVPGRAGGNHRRKFGAAVAFVHVYTEFLLEGLRQLRLHLLRAHNRQSQRRKIFRSATPHVVPGKRGSADQQGNAIFAAQLTDLARLERVRVIDDAEAGNDGKPEPVRETERVKEGQNSQQAVASAYVDSLLHAFNVGDDVAVAEHHSLGNARAAA